jgi:hypothetical protein
MISSSQPILPADLEITLWAGVASHSALVSNQYSENVFTASFKGCSGADDVLPRPRRAYVDWVPSTDIKILGIIVETAGTGLSSSPLDCYLSLATSAQGEIWTQIAPVANGATTRTASTTQFSAKQVVIGGGDLIQIIFENAAFGAAELTKCKVHVVYTHQWGKQ